MAGVSRQAVAAGGAGRSGRAGRPGPRGAGGGCARPGPSPPARPGRPAPPIGLSWWPCSSQEALRLAAEGLVHAAGAHLRDRTGEYNTGTAAELLSAGGEVIGFSAWREGLVLGPAAGDDVAAVTDVVSRGLRLVNRAPPARAPPLR